MEEQEKEMEEQEEEEQVEEEQMTKVIRKILADENRKIFREKVQLSKLFTESEIAFKNRGKSETGGNASLPQGVDAPDHEEKN